MFSIKQRRRQEKTHETLLIMYYVACNVFRMLQSMCYFLLFFFWFEHSKQGDQTTNIPTIHSQVIGQRANNFECFDYLNSPKWHWHRIWTEWPTNRSNWTTNKWYMRSVKWSWKTHTKINTELDIRIEFGELTNSNASWVELNKMSENWF